MRLSVIHYWKVCEMPHSIVCLDHFVERNDRLSAAGSRPTTLLRKRNALSPISEAWRLQNRFEYCGSCLVMLIMVCFDATECNWTERQRCLARWAFSRWKFYQYTSLRVGNTWCCDCRHCKRYIVTCNWSFNPLTPIVAVCIQL